MNYQYKTVVVAGTFDRLHKGHQKLLQKALISGQKVVCALTTPAMNRNKILAQTIQSFTKRQDSIKTFFKWHKADKRMTIEPLNDRFGPTLQKTPIQAIVATKETEKGVDLINQTRINKNLSPLGKIILPKIQAQDKGQLSSTRIRLGEISRQGKVFSLLFKNKDLTLPENQKKHFQKPLGKLLRSDNQSLNLSVFQAKKEIAKKPTPLVITVGDIVTQSFWRQNIPFSLAVIDKKNKRQPLHNSFHKTLFSNITLVKHAQNLPGTISSQAAGIIKKVLADLIMTNQKAILEINGEEDLMVVPLSLLAPLGSLVFYGQPDKGIVTVRVNETVKTKIFNLLAKFVFKQIGE
jgi:phosphopantetheine adenylyltransferase/uncharacterized protein (UPF0218 family)